MKHLVATTALALILSAPAMAQVDQDQQQAVQDQQLTQEQVATGNGFLQRLEASDILAGELIGQDVYAPRADQAVAADQPEAAPQPQDPDATATTPDDGAAAPDQQLQDQQAADQQQLQDQQAAEQQQLQDQQMAQQPQDPQMTGEMQAIDPAQLENMDNIGQISEVIISENGEVRGLVVGVGGFLGIGEREVAIGFDQVSFAVDRDDPNHYYVIADTSADQLENAPEFERTAMTDQQRVDEQAAAPQDEQIARAPDDQQMVEEQRQDDAWRGERQPFAAPQVEREGFAQAEAGEISVDNLIGSNVYDINDDNIGSVNDVVIMDNGEPGYVVVDIGGFLGIGTHTVALGFDEVTVMRTDGWDDVRIYVEATQDQLETMPEYAEAN